MAIYCVFCRKNAKNWQFSVYFVVIYAFFRCKFYSPKICSCKRNDKYQVWRFTTYHSMLIKKKFTLKPWSGLSIEMLPFSQKPGRVQSPWKYSNVWAYVWLALLGSNEPTEVISTIWSVFFNSFRIKNYLSDNINPIIQFPNMTELDLGQMEISASSNDDDF